MTEYTKNAHKEKPGTGVAYFVVPEEKSKPTYPDYEGFVMLEMDYKAGEKMKLSFWMKNTSRGTTLLSIRENNGTKKWKLEEGRDREVKPNYTGAQPARKAPPRPQDDYDDSEIPF